MIELEKELIKGLKVLDENDRDLRTLTIFCNPNFHRGPDKIVKSKILKFLNEMEKQKLVNKKNKIFYWEYRKHTLDVFSLI